MSEYLTADSWEILQETIHGKLLYYSIITCNYLRKRTILNTFAVSRNTF